MTSPDIDAAREQLGLDIAEKSGGSEGESAWTIELAATPVKPRGVLRRLLRSRSAVVGLVVLVGWIVVAMAWPLIVLQDPQTQDLINGLKGPSAGHWFGTDNFGRDVFSRVLAGSRTVVLVALVAACLGVALGTTIGLVAGYYRGWLEEILMRIVDAVMAFPLIVVALIVLAVLGPSKLNVVLVVAVTFAPYNARIIRAAVLAERQRDFVSAARLRGESGPYIMFVEILPNLFGLIVVELTIRLALAVFTVATLSFLGLGIQPPTPDWGLMINENRIALTIQPWPVLLPVLAIALVTIGMNLISDGLARANAGVDRGVEG